MEYALFIIPQAHPGTTAAAEILVLCTLAGAIFGFFGLEYVTIRPFSWVETKLRITPLPDLASAIGGMTVGLVIAALAAYFLRDLPYGLNFVVSAAMALLFGYWGVSIGLGRRDELLALVRGPSDPANVTVIDSSVAIDGRVLGIAQAGFLRGRVVAPHFMLAELQGVADSADATRRQRGRRGLDIIEQLRTLPDVRLEVTDHDYPDFEEVDHKLIRLARDLRGAILTTDYNLNKVAHLEGVSVLNVNDLANALKPAVVPGEQMRVTLLKEGKEPSQGVGYLADGTMVVVEGGRRYVGQTVEARVTSVIQKPAGRMIFATQMPAPAAAGNAS